ncbi:putative T7SS-secreted protein [Streptomyces tubercidicus]
MSLAEQLWGYGGGDPYEDNGNFSGLQFNPAPGVAQAINDLVEDLNRAHKNLTSASDTLRGIHDGACWTGDAAEGFRAKTSPLPKMLDTAGKSFDKARHTLRNWHADLSTMQTTAQSYESDAKAARKRAERAENNPDLQLFRDGGLGMTDAEGEAASARCDRAVSELNAARAQLANIINNAKGLRSTHEEMAGKVAAALSDAAEQAPDEPGFFDGLLKGLKGLAEGIQNLGNEIGQWLKEHANAISALGDVFSAISTVTGVAGLAALMFFPPAELALGSISGLTSLAALMLHDTARGAGGESVVSDRTLIEDMLGTASLGIGKVGSIIGEGADIGKKLINVGRTSGGASGFMTVEDWFGDSSVFGNFLPHSKQEAAVVGGSMLLGGPLGPIAHLGMTLKHAWESGSEKDSES